MRRGAIRSGVYRWNIRHTSVAGLPCPNPKQARSCGTRASLPIALFSSTKSLQPTKAGDRTAPAAAIQDIEIRLSDFDRERGFGLAAKTTRSRRLIGGGRDRDDGRSGA